jgi:hypothetical protein
MKENVPINYNFSAEAKKILEREACKLVYNEEDQLPYGRVITAMTLWLDDHNKWNEIRETIRADRAREAQERRERDRERKRKKARAAKGT